jgi:processive 1,2-diacylglycerol beta-glucosyltransferase
MSRPPRILVLSASVGAGHMRAAEAVELALKELAPDALVRNLDVLELTNAAFRRIYGKAYLDLVTKAPHVLGYFYDMLDRPRRPNSTRDRLRLAVQKMNLGKLVRLLEAEEWDLAVNTHFLPAEIIASLRAKDRLSLPQMTVTTDFETHRLWVHQPCDRYFTATEEGMRYLHAWGVPVSDTAVTGIPIHPVFAKPKDRDACRTKHGIGTDRPVVLQLAGGFGVGPIVKIYESLLSVDRPLEVVAVAGKNAEVKTDLEKVSVPARHRTHVLGFTTQIDELMAAADLVVSKPGGLTTSEVLARGAVMVIVNPIPGQESRNSDYLLESGAAIKANNLGTLAYKVSSLLSDPAWMARLKANVARIARPQAAYDVARQALAMVSARQEGS